MSATTTFSSLPQNVKDKIFAHSIHQDEPIDLIILGWSKTEGYRVYRHAKPSLTLQTLRSLLLANHAVSAEAWTYFYSKYNTTFAIKHIPGLQGRKYLPRNHKRVYGPTLVAMENVTLEFSLFWDKKAYYKHTRHTHFLQDPLQARVVIECVGVYGHKLLWRPSWDAAVEEYGKQRSGKWVEGVWIKKEHSEESSNSWIKKVFENTERKFLDCVGMHIREDGWDDDTLNLIMAKRKDWQARILGEKDEFLFRMSLKKSAGRGKLRLKG